MTSALEIGNVEMKVAERENVAASDEVWKSWGLPRLDAGVQQGNLFTLAVSAIPWIAALGLFGACLVWPTNPVLQFPFDHPIEHDHPFVGTLRNVIEDRVEYYNYAALLSVWICGVILAAWLSYDFYRKRHQLIDTARARLANKGKADAMIT